MGRALLIGGGVLWLALTLTMYWYDPYALIWFPVFYLPLVLVAPYWLLGRRLTVASPRRSIIRRTGFLAVCLAMLFMFYVDLNSRPFWQLWHHVPTACARPSHPCPQGS
jgi:hypothetical protein